MSEDIQPPYPVVSLNTAHSPRPAKRVCMSVPFLLSRNFADLERVLFSGESVCLPPKRGITLRWHKSSVGLL